MTTITPTEAERLGLTAFSTPFLLPAEEALLERWFANVQKYRPEARIVMKRWKDIDCAFVFTKPPSKDPRRYGAKADRGDYPTPVQTVGRFH